MIWLLIASFNVLITIGRILGSFTLGIIYSSFKWGRSTREAIAHEAATNISSSKPFALVSSNALRTEGNTTALLIWAGCQQSLPEIITFILSIFLLNNFRKFINAASDYSSTMLIIVENWNGEFILKSFYDVKYLWWLYIFNIYSSKDRFDRLNKI